MPEDAPREGNGARTAFAIRPIRDGDEEAVAELRRACGLVRPWNDPIRDIGSARANTWADIFVAVTAGDCECIAGSVMAGNDGHRGWIYYVAVGKEHRSRGLGEELMRHAEAWLSQLGVAEVMLMIREENEAVRRFYEALGYKVERRTVMCRWTDGRN